MEDVKEQLGRHLASMGFEFGTPREAVWEKLRQRMGDERHGRLRAVMDRHESAQSQEEVYTLIDDIVEANLFRSLSPGVTLDASYELYRRCLPRLVSGTRVTELGCWTGGLASFIAARHPRCPVAGVDLAQQVVDACNAYPSYRRLPNLRFRKWNYRFGKPQDLEPADVLLCALGVVHHLPGNTRLPDLADVRRSGDYLTQRDHATGYFSAWRSAANDGALLFAVFRLQLFPRFLAWLDAAQATGWTPLLDQLWHVDLPGERSVLPGLVFEASTSAPLAEEAVLERFAWFTRRDHVYACLKGGEALAAFRAMAPKAALAAREYRAGRWLTRDEIGSAGPVGYVFTDDAAAHYRLLLVSHARAKFLAAGASAKGSDTPITDEAVFRGGAAAAGNASPFATGTPGGGSGGGTTSPSTTCPFFGGTTTLGRPEDAE